MTVPSPHAELRRRSLPDTPEDAPSRYRRLATGELNLHGWVYDIESGAVQAHNEMEGAFRAIELDSNDGTRAADDGFELMAR